MKMRFNETSMRILVRKDYGKCFDFYTEKIGLVPVWGDRNGPYTAFAVKEGAPACIATFAGKNTEAFKGYAQPAANAPQDTAVAVIRTEDVAGDYQRLKEKGVEFLGEPQRMDDWGGFNCTYFRDPEGNLFELMDGWRRVSRFPAQRAEKKRKNREKKDRAGSNTTHCCRV